MAATRADIETYKALMQRGELDAALSHLAALLNIHTGDRGLLAVTAPLALRLGRNDLARRCYNGLLDFEEISAPDLFAIGYALKTAGDFERAVAAYQKSLGKGLEQPEDAYLNMGVIFADELHDVSRAADAFKKAIALNPSVLPPYINLGNLYEETGKFAEAVELYAAAVQAVPNGFEALARMGNAHNFTDPQDPLLAKLKTALTANAATAFDKECLHFALGTAYNSLKLYVSAWHHYEQGNAHGLSYGLPYDPEKMEAYCDEIIASFTPNIFKVPVAASGDSPCPVFICGMFRSGSTLTEQVLGAHPDFTALGECEFIPKIAHTSPDFYPRGTAALSAEQLSELRAQYMQQNAAAAVITRFFTDKRPDNVLYLGLIKQIFPQAKIVHTVRAAKDNYLSIYFTQFGDGQAYARRWEHIAHYHGQQKRLMDHWRTLFGDDIIEIAYDDFVAAPEPSAKVLLSAIGAPWHEATLNFHTQKNRVKTASYKQVRRPLYASSSGRWKNYAPWIPEL